jgi:acetyl-CoA synthetase
MLFGPEALAYRLQDSQAVLAVADESAIANLRAARGDCPDLRTVVAVGGAAGQGDAGLDSAELAQTESPFEPVARGPTMPPC